MSTSRYMASGKTVLAKQLTPIDVQ